MIRYDPVKDIIYIKDSIANDFIVEEFGEDLLDLFICLLMIIYLLMIIVF